jgi:YHS domain-containing protein
MNRQSKMEELMAIDPVCGMSVDEKTAPAQANHQGKTYYFCSEDCKTKFQQQPDKYTKQPTSAR